MHSSHFDDNDVRNFIVNGYTLVHADYPPEFHRSIYDQIETVLDKEGNPGNNILPRIPALHQIFEHPTVAAALTALLGPNYTMHPHRYCHLNPPGKDGQTWHKDDYIYDQNVRHHRHRWVMAFYYPQDVSEDMGPTGILPGRQYYDTISNNDATQSSETELRLCGPAGTVAIVHFDSWHRATANTSAKKRYMLKFQFTRMQEPQTPTWHQPQTDWQPVEHDAHNALSQHVWHWLGGRNGTRNGNSEDKSTLAKLAQQLRHQDENKRLNAAYALGTAGAQAIPHLLDALHSEAADLAQSNQTSDPANPKGGNPAELYAAHALAAVGAPAISALTAELQHADPSVRAAAADVLGNLDAQEATPALRQCLADENFWVRRNAAEALGYIADTNAVPELGATLVDADWRIRLNSALALAKIGTLSADCVPTLGQLMDDENRYVRYYAALALRHSDMPSAKEVLWEHLLTSRWCPLTTNESTF